MQRAAASYRYPTLARGRQAWLKREPTRKSAAGSERPAGEEVEVVGVGGTAKL